MTGWNHPGLLATRDSPYGRITVTALAGQVSVFDAELPGFGAAENELATIGWILGIVLPLLFFGSRLWPAWRRGLLAAVAGFLGIVSEAVLILAYQAKEGVLYQDIIPIFGLAGTLKGMILLAALGILLI